jgi:hypothetical protein
MRPLSATSHPGHTVQEASAADHPAAGNAATPPDSPRS